MPTLTFEPWQVVKVPFPYTKGPAAQWRPALVVASLSDTGGPHILWIAMITSAGHRRWSGDVELTALATAGLSAPSMVRLAKLASVEATLAQPLGRVTSPVQRATRRWLRGTLRVLKLDSPEVG